MTMARRYYRIDDSDPPYPALVECAAHEPGAMSFRAARSQLRKNIAWHIEHWRTIRDRLPVIASDVTEVTRDLQIERDRAGR